ncbi:MAG: crotonase/enoyl-CoA hydratase family protein [Acidimicrobiia bacterium]|nr:crotonase/enoyl-CoA hydratase family protein [Acidimicrobiia bacterium]
MSERHPHGQVLTRVVDDHIWEMTFDRHEKRNACTPKLFRELSEALTRLDDDPELWVGVLRFAGDHTTGGLDMPLFFAEDADGFAMPDGLVDPFGLRRRLRAPLVVAVQGITYTAGIEMALAADIVVASEDARFSQLEPKRGLAALGGATFRFVERGGWGNAMYHLLRGDEFDAHEAHRVGICQEVVPVGTQADRALELAREIAACAPLAVEATKANARLAVDDGEAAAIAEFGPMQRRLAATEDFAEGVASFIERRQGRFTGR